MLWPLETRGEQPTKPIWSLSWYFKDLYFKKKKTQLFWILSSTNSIYINVPIYRKYWHALKLTKANGDAPVIVPDTQSLSWDREELAVLLAFTLPLKNTQMSGIECQTDGERRGGVWGWVFKFKNTQSMTFFGLH